MGGIGVQYAAVQHIMIRIGICSSLQRVRRFFYSTTYKSL